MGEVVMVAIAASWIIGVVMGWILYSEVVNHNAQVARRRRARL